MNGEIDKSEPATEEPVVQGVKGGDGAVGGVAGETIADAGFTELRKLVGSPDNPVTTPREDVPLEPFYDWSDVLKPGEERPWAMQIGREARVERLGCTRGAEITEMSFGPAFIGRPRKDVEERAKKAGVPVPRRYFSPEEIRASAFKETRVLRTDSVAFKVRNTTSDDLRFTLRIQVSEWPIAEGAFEWSDGDAG